MTTTASSNDGVVMTGSDASRDPYAREAAAMAEATVAVEQGAMGVVEARAVVG